jgi:hypothetical protein
MLATVAAAAVQVKNSLLKLKTIQQEQSGEMHPHTAAGHVAD